jgi:hypothetical protein
MIALTAPDGSQILLSEETIISISGAVSPSAGRRARIFHDVGEAEVAEEPADIVREIGCRLSFVRLTRPDKQSVWINTSAILILSSPELGGPRVLACIYFEAGQQGVMEDPASIAKLLESALTFIPLTRPNNTPVWINTAAITTITAPKAGDVPPGSSVRAVLHVGSRFQGVQEDVATIRGIRQLVDARAGAP